MLGNIVCIVKPRCKKKNTKNTRQILATVTKGSLGQQWSRATLHQHREGDRFRATSGKPCLNAFPWKSSTRGNSRHSTSQHSLAHHKKQVDSNKQCFFPLQQSRPEFPLKWQRSCRILVGQLLEVNLSTSVSALPGTVGRCTGSALWCGLTLV